MIKLRKNSKALKFDFYPISLHRGLQMAVPNLPTLIREVSDYLTISKFPDLRWITVYLRYIFDMKQSYYSVVYKRSQHFLGHNISFNHNPKCYSGDLFHCFQMTK